MLVAVMTMVLVMLVVLVMLMVTVVAMMSINDGHNWLHHLINGSVVPLVSVVSVVSVLSVVRCHHTSNHKGCRTCHTSRRHSAGHMWDVVSWSCSVGLRRSAVSIGLRRRMGSVWLTTIGLRGRRGCTISVRLRLG